MDPRTGMVFELSGEGDDPPFFGATMDAEAAKALLAEKQDDLEAKAARLDEMAKSGDRVVAVDEAVVQKLRLGEKELRRRKQRRR